jgi:hypothetical protein
MVEYNNWSHQEVKFPAVEEHPIAVNGKWIDGYKSIYNPETEHE